MITQLYTFSAGSYVVAEEWNANFRTLYKANLAHEEAIVDAQAQIAFPTSDLTGVYNAVRSQLNSFAIPGNTVTVAPECEYYKTLAGGQELIIDLGNLSDAETRILIKIEEDRTRLEDLFTIINYTGTTIIDYGYYNYEYFRAGYYYIMIYETNGIAQVKLIWTGV